MSDTVYLITSGCYSDYGIHMACPDEATAEAVAARLNAAEGVTRPDGYNGYGVEAVPEVSSVDNLRFVTTWSVRLFISNEAGSTAWSESWWEIGKDPTPPKRRVDAPRSLGPEGRGLIRQSIIVHHAATEAEAWKIARERRAQLLAVPQGILYDTVEPDMEEITVRLPDGWPNTDDPATRG